MKNLLVLIVLSLNSVIFAQDYTELRHVQNDSFKIDFYVSTDHKKIKYKDTVLYTWYKSKKVMTTQGSSAGDILNGTFKKHYLSGQLAESGEYKMGLKTGKWQQWDANGLLISIKNYKKGQLNGRCYQYENGQLSQLDKYKKGALKPKKEPKVKEEIQDSSEDTEKGPLFKRVFKKKDKENSNQSEEKTKEKKKWFSKKDDSTKTKEKPKKSKKTKQQDK